jgi:hypothetical protein
MSKYKVIMKEIKQTQFDIVISLFRLLTSKDIFENFYTKYLAERLL